MRLPVFFFRGLIMFVAAALALGLLAFLLHVTQGQPLDPELHGLRLEQLSSAAQLDQALDQQFEQARLAMEPQTAEIARLRERIEAQHQALSNSFAVAGLGGRVGAALQTYLETAHAKDELAAQAQSQLQDFVERFDRTRQQGDAAIAALQAAEDAPRRRAAMALLSAITGYSIQAAPSNGQEITALLSDLTGEARGTDEEKHGQLMALAASVQGLQSAKDALQGQLEQMNAVPVAPALQRLRGAYLDYTAAQERKREQGRVILAVYVGALFLAFGVVALRLRGSFGELDRANIELQHVNESLEQRIGERTRDLSKALEDLRLNQAHLIQSEKMASLGQMVAGVAHEINTPLGYASSNVETVREVLGALPRPDAETGEQIDEAGTLLADARHGLERIAELVLTLKDFSRVDRSRTELFNLNDSLEAALKICHNQLKDRIEVQREYAELPLIPCAPSQLNQVFLNLITNAAQAIDGRGTIAIATRDLGDRVQVQLRDSGCGMPQDVLAHIFEPFFTTKPVGKGTGLGLSIAYRIIEEHHGSISAQSAPGQGTVFTISLPTQPPSQPEPAGSR